MDGEKPTTEDLRAGRRSTPRLDRLVELARPPLEREGAMWRHYGQGCFGKDWATVATAIFSVDDFDRADAVLAAAVAGTEFEDAAQSYRWFEDREVAAPGDTPESKTLEICYDVASIPEGFGDPIDFRNAAMELIEAALEAEEAGEWIGAESGMGEVSFGFEVQDFDAAERIVRAAVAGSPFAGIGRIDRGEFPGD